MKSYTKIKPAPEYKQIIRFQFFGVDWNLGHLTDSSACTASKGPIMAYPKIVETWRECRAAGGPKMWALNFLM